MNASDIISEIKRLADARFGEVIEKVLLNLRYHHTHQCRRKECECEYCQFINGPYIREKLALQKLKRRIRYYDQIWWLTDMEMEKVKILHLKDQKKEMQREIL